jgi:hypothetical protein
VRHGCPSRKKNRRRWLLVSRDEFTRFRSENPVDLTDIQRAVRFYYLLRNGYSARIPEPTFSISTLTRANSNLLRLEEELSMVHLRLARVYIENLLTRKSSPPSTAPTPFSTSIPPITAVRTTTVRESFPGRLRDPRLYPFLDPRQVHPIHKRHPRDQIRKFLPVTFTWIRAWSMRCYERQCTACRRLMW